MKVSNGLANGAVAASALLALTACAPATSTMTPAASAAPVAEPAPEPATPEERIAALAPVTQEMREDPAPGDWLHWGRTYDGKNFSPLDIINRDNVASLAPAWTFELTPGLSMPTPLIHDGVMFLHTAPDTVIAIDAASGQEMWRHVHAPTVGSTMKMGLGLGDGHVFAPMSDLRVVALDARTGEKTWDHEIQLSEPATDRSVFNLRSAPLVVGDKIIQGVTASAGPGGGFIVGLDSKTGEEVWRFHTTARPDGPGGNTWNDLPVGRRTGGSVWDQGTYDPDLHLVFFGAGPTYDTAPLRHPIDKPGVTNDALYTNATMALDPDTGELKWHYQHLRNDQWDLDWAFERTIAMVNVDGQDRKVVMNVGKMGILDALDPETGAYLFSIDAETQNVITAIDPETGEKTIDPNALPDPSRAPLICPGASGARSWPPTSYSPQTGMLYLPLTEWCMRMGAENSTLLSAPGAGISNADHPDAVADGKMGRLQAMDVNNKTLAWKQDLDSPVATSALATAGGVVFAGDLEPALKAFDAATGDLLWTGQLDSNPNSTLATYAVGDTQYVVIVTGFANYHISAMAPRYQKFRADHGLTPVAQPTGPAAIHVFALSK